MVDFLGQKTSEYLYYGICVATGVIAWLIGYYNEDLGLSVKIWAGGLVLSLFISIPDWPMYNTRPVVWLKEVGKKDTVGGELAPSPKKTKKKDVEEDWDGKKDDKVGAKEKSLKNKKDIKAKAE
jgi:signal peptidase complex subunit 1